MSDTESEKLRADIWLWRARFYKTRALAGAQIKKRGVRITRHGQTRRTDKPGSTVSTGDVVTFGRSPHIRTVEVLGLGTRRGPASEAEALYRDLGDEE